MGRYVLCSVCKEVTVVVHARPTRTGSFISLGRWCYHCRTLEVTNSSVKILNNQMENREV